MRRVTQHFDLLLLGATVLLALYGIIMIYSATYLSAESGQSLWDTFFARQITYALAGLGLMFLVTIADYRYLESLYHPLYILTILSLLLLPVVGRISFGAQRWLGFGRFQPSELAKLLIIIILAKYLSDRGPRIKRFPQLLISLIYVAIPMVLIYLQPDLGTALILGVIWLVMVLMAGARLRHIIILVLLSLLGTPLIWLSLEDYMRERIIIFFNPQYDPLGVGYNINQARIAVGSGGWWGRGFGSGSQNQLHFLRVRHTDYIFSVLGEELGFVGVLLLLLLLGIVLLRILRVADLARDDFGKLIACGVATMIAFQAFVNIGMNIALIPAAGTSLPFVSYGGSGLITLLLAEGVVQSILVRHRKLEFP
jgi:rod shape determining protein RodA